MLKATERLKTYRYINIITLILNCTEPVFANLLRSPGIDSQPGGIDSSESIPGLLHVYKYGLSILAVKRLHNAQVSGFKIL